MTAADLSPQARVEIAELRREVETWKDTAGALDASLSEAKYLLREVRGEGVPLPVDLASWIDSFLGRHA